MAQYIKTRITVFPKINDNVTPDTLYWKHLETPVIKKEHGIVSNLDFSPIAPYPYAVTAGTRVQVNSSQTQETIKSLTVAKDIVYGGSFRDDGQMVVLGGEEKKVYVYNLQPLSVLRTFHHCHTKPIHVTRFLDRHTIMSAGKDRMVCIFDLGSGSPVSKYNNDHKDDIMAGVVNKRNSNIFATGSYDQTVKLYDRREDKGGHVTMSMDHGDRVESLLMHPTGNILMSAGGNTIKVWDIVGGGRLIASLTAHHKTISSMCYASNHQRFISGGLDNKIKIYDAASYQVVHSINYTGPVTSVGVSPDDSVLVVGMGTTLNAQKRRDAEEIAAVKFETFKRKRVTNEFFHAMKEKKAKQQAAEDDAVIEHKRKEQLAKYDKYFKKFEMTKALDAAMDLRVRRKNPEVTVSVMQELIRRSAIHAALSGREDESIANILFFIQKNIANVKYCKVLCDVSSVLFEVYKDKLIDTESPLYKLFTTLKTTIKQICTFADKQEDTAVIFESLFAATYV